MSLTSRRSLMNLVNGQLPILRCIKDLLEVRDIDFLFIRILKDAANAGVKRHVINIVGLQEGKHLMRILAFEHQLVGYFALGYVIPGRPSEIGIAKEDLAAGQ